MKDVVKVILGIFLHLSWPIFIFISNLWPLSVLKQFMAKNLGKPGNSIFEKFLMRKVSPSDCSYAILSSHELVYFMLCHVINAVVAIMDRSQRESTHQFPSHGF